MNISLFCNFHFYEKYIILNTGNQIVGSEINKHRRGGSRKNVGIPYPTFGRRVRDSAILLSGYSKSESFPAK